MDPRQYVLNNLLNSHLSVDGDQFLSHLHPRCPVKLQAKHLYVLKPHTINWLLSGLHPMHSLHRMIRTKMLGREGRLQKGKTIEYKRPSTGCEAKETIVGTRLVNLWQREVWRNLRPWLCWEGQPNEHQDMSCTRRQCHLDIWPHPQAFH